MAIGDLYDANNVVVGQAAALFAPQFTALPDLSTFSFSDPLSTDPWTSQTLTVGTGSITITDANGKTGTITASGETTTEASVASALNGLDDDNTWTVSGTAGGPFTITNTGGDAAPLTASGAGLTSLTGGLWTPCGATDQGWTYGTNKSTTTIDIEEQSTPVGTTISTQSVTLEASLSEDITRTLQLAYNGVLTRSAATADAPATDTVVLTDDVLYYAVALITQNYNGTPRIIYAPKWTQLSNVSTAFRRAAAKRMYPVSFATVCKPGQIQAINLTAPATS